MNIQPDHLVCTGLLSLVDCEGNNRVRILRRAKKADKKAAALAARQMSAVPESAEETKESTTNERQDEDSTQREEDTKEAESDREIPRGPPVVPFASKHAASSLHRHNVHREYNGGCFVGEQKRWANMSIESINRNTNRYRFSQNGAYGVAGMFVRNAIIHITSNFKALDDYRVLTKLHNEQPEVLHELQSALRDCRELHDLQRELAKVGHNNTLCIDLRTSQEQRDERERIMVTQYMIQFSSDKVAPEYVNVGSVKAWVYNQADDWRFSADELRRCFAEMEAEQSAPMRLEDLRISFSRLGYTVKCQSSEEWLEIVREIEADNQIK